MASRKQKNKMRDIARSVLPSTARRAARHEKRNLKQQHRTRTKQTLADVATLVDPDEAPAQLIFDTYHAKDGIAAVSWDNMNEIINNRRGHDKLGPLLRWARTLSEREMKGWSDEDKYQWFKAALPDTLQGRHALSHIEIDQDLNRDEFSYRFYRRQSDYPKTLLDTKEKLRAKLNWILRDNKRHARYVEMMRECIPSVGHRTEEVIRYSTSTVPKLDENGDVIYQGEHPYRRPLTEDVKVPVYKLEQCAGCKLARNWDGMEIEPMVDFLVQNSRWKTKRTIKFAYQDRDPFQEYRHQGKGASLLNMTLDFE